MRMKTCSESGTSPLASVLDQFARRLVSMGYAATTREHYGAHARRFDRYLLRVGASVSDLCEVHVDAFLDEIAARSRGGCGGAARRRGRRRPLELLLGLLREDGVIRPAPAIVEDTGPGVADYLDFLREHRGLSQRTLDRQRRYVGRFLALIQARCEDDLRSIQVEQIDRFLVETSRRVARETMGSVASSLRGFLGFLYVRGTLDSDLRPHVATPKLHRLERLPRAVAWSDIQRTLALIDRSTAVGRRDYAIFTLIAYSGLRACDVAALRLPDIDWRRDVIHAPRPKAGSVEDVPLIAVVGEALIAYLRERPSCCHDEVFLTVNAPPRPLAATRISWRAATYLRRAGVRSSKLGSHTLRHSFAVELLRQRRTLKEIGDALGHTHPQSTYIYAKAGIEQLRDVGLPVDAVLPPDFPCAEARVEDLRTVALDLAAVLS